MLTLTFANRHRTQQADMPVPYDAADTGREDGQKTVVEWRYRADPGDPWGAPTISIVDTPATASYTAPAAGWVQVTCYSTRDGVTSWQRHVGEFAVDGSGTPVSYETFNVTDNGGEPFAVSEGDFMVKETP